MISAFRYEDLKVFDNNLFVNIAARVNICILPLYKNSCFIRKSEDFTPKKDLGFFKVFSNIRRESTP